MESSCNYCTTGSHLHQGNLAITLELLLIDVGDTPFLSKGGLHLDPHVKTIKGVLSFVDRNKRLNV